MHTAHTAHTARTLHTAHATKYILQNVFMHVDVSAQHALFYNVTMVTTAAAVEHNQHNRDNKHWLL